jgi:AAA15 family ATPase/GTPase
VIIESIEVEKFRAIENLLLNIGKNITAIAGRNATLKTTLLGMLGQPFTISSVHPMYGCTTIDGYNFRSQFKEKFKISKDFDHYGEHIWTLKFYRKGYYSDDEIKMISIRRPTKTNPNDIRFWNAKSKAKGTGYVQLPVYYLSLSRLFPIGETGKTKNIDIQLSDYENTYFVRKYKELLSIHDSQNAVATMEKADARRNFIGVNDNSHDVFTNSAGESNIGKIILAILSFRRLKEEYGDKYKGGILLIDELDATLYGYSQKKLVEFLYTASKEFNIQMIFTTHSPIVLQEVNNLQRKEVRRMQEQSIDVTTIPYNYESEIIYLESYYVGEVGDSRRMVKGKNIRKYMELKEITDDINMQPSIVRQSVNVYLEDARAKQFLLYLLSQHLEYNFENYFNIVDVDLGFTNYLHLHKKKVPEFVNSLIVLDHDVNAKATRNQLDYVENSTKNIIFLPEDVEKGMFKILKDPIRYSNFESTISEIRMPYDICFKDWTEDDYSSDEYKRWFAYMEETLGGAEKMYAFWHSKNESAARKFVYDFINAYNLIADRQGYDYMMGIPDYDVAKKV